MTETGWIIVVLVAVVAIILTIMLLRRKGSGETLIHDPSVAEPAPQPIPSPTQEPPAALTPAVAERIATPPSPEPRDEEEAPVPIDLSGALAQNDEPITVSTPPVAAAAVPPAPQEGGDNLLRLKGVGPKIATLLKAEGITRYAQIAAWSDADLAAIDAKLGSFAGRPRRDNWVDQARLLASGDTAAYEATYGKL